MTTSARLMMCAVALATLALAACETPTRVIDTSVNSFRPIPYSARDTCETQAAVAEHNAVYDTLKTGRPVVYKPPCALAPKAPAPSAAVRARIKVETEWHKPQPEVDPARARRVGVAEAR